MRLEGLNSKETRLKLRGFCDGTLYLLLVNIVRIGIAIHVNLGTKLLANKRARRAPLYRSLWSAINKSWPTANLAKGKGQRANWQSTPAGTRFKNCMFRLLRMLPRKVGNNNGNLASNETKRNVVEYHSLSCHVNRKQSNDCT